MAPPKSPAPRRSLLRIDHKTPASRRSTPALRQLGLASLTAAALVGAYALLNAPSASTEAALDDAPDTLEFTASQSDSASAFADNFTGHSADDLGDDALTTASDIALIKRAPLSPDAINSAANPHADAFAEHAAPEFPPPQRQPREIANFAPDAIRDNAMDAPQDIPWITATVKRGDTLSRIFQRHRVNLEDAYATVKLADGAALRTIRAGQSMQLASNRRGQLTALRYPLDTFSTLRVHRQGQTLVAEVITRAPEIRRRVARATIRHSLMEAAKGAGIDFEIVYRLAKIFGWQVDFTREIRAGDQFSVIFEERYLDGKKVGNGDILAAELIVSKRTLRAMRHFEPRDNGNDAPQVTYYAPNGDGIQRSFLRSPLEFGRVSSKFARKRFHPILKQWRAHKGVDYAARRGTPVRSTSDGVVERAGRHGGYGKRVVIRHGVGYSTLYAHLNGFAKDLKTGARVRQGEVIGYVGSSGWATGPHLHYEFRIDGAHRNPLTVELPRSAPIAARHKPAFLAQARAWAAQLKRIGSSKATQIDLAEMDAAPVARLSTDG